jgi:hypothetical protein
MKMNKKNRNIAELLFFTYMYSDIDIVSSPQNKPKYKNVTQKFGKYGVTLLLIPFLSFVTVGDAVLFPST